MKVTVDMLIKKTEDINKSLKQITTLEDQVLIARVTNEGITIMKDSPKSTKDLASFELKDAEYAYTFLEGIFLVLNLEA